MENKNYNLPTVEEYMKLKESPIYKIILNACDIEDDIVSAFEKIYYPELQDKEDGRKDAKEEEVEEEVKEEDENIASKPPVTRAWLEDFIRVYEQYSEKVKNYLDLGVDVYLSNFPVDDCEDMLLKSLKLIFNKEEFEILYDFCEKIDNGENPSFDELCKNLKIE